ncbi:MAG: HNH endonuclease [Magnetococcales bacterium]|nr:HNH endonuclease [Magnetococcales bacterium]
MADPDQIERERRKARELRQSAWWKNRLATGQCAYCRGRFPPSELTMDHAVPLVRGGRTTRGNCVPACRSCNQAKQNLPAQEWLARMDSIAYNNALNDTS